MFRVILNKSWWQHPTRHQLYGHLPPITKTIQVRGTRHAGHCWRSRDELISDVLQWTSAYGRAKVGRPPRTYIQQLCEDTGCSPEDLPEAMNDREKWRENSRISVLAARHDDDDEVVIIIIIMLCHRHRYPWPSLTTSPYRSSPLASFRGYIPYPHIAAVCMFELAICEGP